MVAETSSAARRAARAEGEDGAPDLRTSVMTHLAWAPPQRAAAARRTLEGLEERHPSRTILLVPEPRRADGVDAVSMQCFAIAGEREVCSEVIELRLGGKRAPGAGSIVLPLLISDLPAFCRWRGEPPWGTLSWRSSSRSATGSSSTPRSGAELRPVQQLGAALRPGCGLGHRVGARRSAGAGGSRRSGRRSAVERLSVRGRRRTRSCSPGGWARGSGGTSRSTRRSAGELARVAVDGSRRSRSGGRQRERLLSAELDVFGRDPSTSAVKLPARPRSSSARARVSALSASSCSKPFDASALPPSARSARKVGQPPPASSTISFEGPPGPTESPRLDATSTAPSASSMYCQKSPKPRGRPAPLRQRREALVGSVEARVREHGVLDPLDRATREAIVRPHAPWPRTAHQRLPSAGAETTRDAVLERDQRREDRNPADVVRRPVDRVEDPALALARVGAELLAEHALAGALVRDPLAERSSTARSASETGVRSGFVSTAGRSRRSARA